ncbi:MAG TPA: hypothetical protein VEC57_13120 [Candidatus Limnocylindrales bacterium]|nr:hypothetical protein [Candidatus Limnocylindrales bacterium]
MSTATFVATIAVAAAIAARSTATHDMDVMMPDISLEVTTCPSGF